MRSAAELSQVRREIVARRELDAEARNLHARLEDLIAPGGPVNHYYCTERHRRGRSAPTLARTYPIDPVTVLLVSRIDWRPNDPVVLPPWEREYRLGASQNDDTMAHLASDDRMLSNLLDDLDRLQNSGSVGGERWLKSTGPHVIYTVFRAGQGEPLISAWLRCKDHPGTHECLHAEQVFAATR